MAELVKSEKQFQIPFVAITMGVTPLDEMKYCNHENVANIGRCYEEKPDKEEFIELLMEYICGEGHHVGLIVFNEKKNQYEMRINQIMHVCVVNGCAMQFHGSGNEMYNLQEYDCDLLKRSPPVFCFWLD